MRRTPWQFFTSHPEPELGRGDGEGSHRRSSRGWAGIPLRVPDPQDPATFQRSKLRWDERDAGDHARLSRSTATCAAAPRASRAHRPRRPRILRRRVSEGADACAPIVPAPPRHARGAREPHGRRRDVRRRRHVLLATDAATALSGDALVLPPDSAAVVEITAGRRRLSRPRDAPCALGRRAQSTPSHERSVRTMGPSSVIATVCSECAPREPSALRSVQPSGSVTSSSVVGEEPRLERHHEARAQRIAAVRPCRHWGCAGRRA